MTSPVPGEIWQFTRHTKIKERIIAPGDLIFVLASDPQSNQGVFRISGMIGDQQYDFYTPSSYLKKLEGEIDSEARGSYPSQKENER